METTTKKIPMWVFTAILATPFLYVIYTWNSLPQQVPLHFGMDGKVDRYGSKFEFLFFQALMFVIGLGVSWLTNNIEKIDPKRAAKQGSLMKKISLLLVFFLGGAMMYTTYVASGNEKTFSAKIVLVSVTLLISFSGNLMNNIKPNYFVGIRTPWTLENEDVWRKTHHFASRLWFFGGLLLAAFLLILPETVGVISFIAGIVTITVVPLVYSYRTYRSSKNNVA